MIESVVPEPLFRTVGKYRAVENHLLGILWFRSPSYFHNTEGAGRDPLEGVGSYNLPNGVTTNDVGDHAPIQPTFVLSFSEVPLSQYGEYVLKVQNPTELKKCVERRLPQGISEVEWRKIRYNKKMLVESHPSPSEDWIRKHYSKPRKYENEREWRLVIRFLHSFPILNKTLKLSVGDLQSLFRLQPPGDRLSESAKS